jgi:2-polyprenyl-6-methoxyphenol hydroxylase-like FAD-dependent oxidoreductase
MRIAIVGAGIGGLSAAVGLQRAGAEVTVFERAPAVRAGGSGLSLFANGLARRWRHAGPAARTSTP